MSDKPKFGIPENAKKSTTDKEPLPDINDWSGDKNIPKFGVVPTEKRPKHLRKSVIVPLPRDRADEIHKLADELLDDSKPEGSKGEEE